MADMIVKNVSPKLNDLPVQFRKLVTINPDGDYIIDADDYADAMMRYLTLTLANQIMDDLEVTPKELTAFRKAEAARG